MRLEWKRALRGQMRDSKAERLFLLAQKIAERTPGFFEIKGPGHGDRAALEFMRSLRDTAKGLFGQDFSEKKVSEGANFSIDFYIEDEATAIEVALSLHQPLTEYERKQNRLRRDRGQSPIL